MTDTCPLCAFAVHEVGLPDILECPSCGLTFKKERCFYAPKYGVGLEEGIYGSAKTALFATALDRLELSLPEKGRLLDVGCAGGEFMKAAAARGWRASGVELDPALAVKAAEAGFSDIRIRNSPPTSGDPYRTGGRLGGFLTGTLKVLYYWLAQALWCATFGRVHAGSSLIATACKPAHSNGRLLRIASDTAPAQQ